MKQTNDRYNVLLSELFTVYQRDSTVVALQKAIDAEYDTVKNPLTVLQMSLPFTLVDAILDIAKHENIELGQPAGAKIFYQELIDVLKALPLLELKLAFTPTYDQLKEITSWWRDLTQVYVLLDIVIDKHVLAGAVIGFEGNMQDFTLNKYLSNTLPQTRPH
jgi:F0F1-type ATP synthase delta subunit